MTGTSRRGLWLNLALVSALVWATLPGFAQSAKLELNNLEKLSDKAAEVNDVTLEGALLELASKFLDVAHDPDAAQLKEVLQGLKGIYIKNFEFDEPDQYSQADVDAIRAQLAGPGWTRIVESHSRRSREHDEIYVMKQGEGDRIAGLAILVAEARELTVVNIVGNIDINKLGLLEGHFGIPDDESGHHKRKHKNDDARPAKDRDKDKNDKAQADMEDSDDDN